MDDDRISLAHGNGGRFMRELIEDVFATALSASEIDVQADAVPIDLDGGEVMITTDGFTVQPLEFPGGDIGSLAVHGTTNDLAVAGARPMYLTLNAFIEEGFEVEQLERIVRSLAEAAVEAGVRISAGDTKVVRRGEGGGIYLATTGVGVRLPGARPALGNIRDGDVMIVSGPVGDHGTAVMLAREEFGLRGDLVSDAGPVMALTEPLLAFDGLRFMRDPTRGGIASIGHEILRATGLGVRFEATVPVREPVQSVCEMLGYDPYYLACEGRVLAILAPGQADEALALWRGLPEGKEAERIGRISAAEQRVVLETPLGGERFLEELEDDPLPRIC
ncbi:MAG: hydrogenase expression/formation protein HypE [Gammaproteobacteria bacterium]|nr:hydrogenase expression/formation protein HypE [Gammaproteobacteria bacterium]MBT8106201.1 hydrogenase expression/formation protein HypE [Gammaproteobacteria bacterium]NNF50461.1 hydrogenase expression/formation protein HypE [Woeseiaceae bacterium]NNK26215.1 hydrogenase expression/formation protein HypE [Woeseiaceae bacterium]NNL64251.1 hydrogenase expression/formation protein HypE [Woeseiaceae bacterium]